MCIRDRPWTFAFCLAPADSSSATSPWGVLLWQQQGLLGVCWLLSPAQWRRRPQRAGQSCRVRLALMPFPHRELGAATGPVITAGWLKGEEHHHRPEIATEVCFSSSLFNLSLLKSKNSCKSKCGVIIIQGGAEQESGYRTVCSIGAVTISLHVLILKLQPQVRL